ncbi:glycosyltransferase family 87 protein [Blastococcus sp. SYSU D00820]
MQASEAVGGPWGRHAVTGRALFWTPLRICLLMATAVLALAWVKQAPCSDGDWAGSKQYTHLCYSDAVPLWSIHGLDEGAVPYLDAPVEYPVLTGGFMTVAAGLAHGYGELTGPGGLLPVVPPVQAYAVITALMLSLCAFVVVRSVLALAGRRPWDAAMVALSPLLLFHAFTNWDLLALALTGLGMWAWARSHPVLAGALLGLAVAAKFYPLLVLGALFLLCLRAGRLAAWTRAAAAAVVAWLVVNVPVALLAFDGWATFYSFSSSRPANPETLWNLALTLSDDRLFDGPLLPGQTPVVLNAVIAAVLLVFGLAVAWTTLAAPVRPRWPQLAFVLVAGFLLFNKVWSPQFSLWLLPLAVLARPRWRSLLLWQATEVLVWVLTMLWYLGTANRGVDEEWFWMAVLLRDVALVVLAGLVVRDMWRPDGDVVRTSWRGVDDPTGGPLVHAPDRFTLPRPRRRERAADPVPAGTSG